MAEESNSLPDDQPTICCSKHSEEKCTFVCVNCTELICDDCVDIVEHTGHEIKSIKKFIKEVNLQEFKESFESLDCCKIKVKILNETEMRFQKANDGMQIQASQMISEVNRIKGHKLKECEERKTKNIVAVNEVFAVVDPSDMLDKIENLPTKGGRTQYAEVAHALLKYQKKMESEELARKGNASVYVPTFTHGKIQKSRLEKLFGDLVFEEVDIDNLFDTEEETTESESSDDENTEEEDNEKHEECNDENDKGESDFLASEYVEEQLTHIFTTKM